MEHRGEFVSATFRILISFTMVASVMLLVSTTLPHSPIFVVSLVYAIASIVGIVLVLLSINHPTIPYIFVLIDSAVVAFALSMFARMSQMGMSATIALPLFSLAFVILIHSALRYRPWLVAFGAFSFVGLLFLLPLGLSELPMGNPVNSRMMHGRMMMQISENINYLPVVFFSLSAVLLFYIVFRSRTLAYLAQNDGQRAAQLSRFFSPEVANRLADIDERNESFNGGPTSVSVLFIDIRGFSHISESLSSEQLTEFLSAFRTEICGLVLEAGGTIDKFIGDAILVVFGTPHQRPDDAQRAADTAFKISIRMREWSRERSDMGKQGALVGIGGHKGKVFAGIIRSGQILEHTIIGETVNVAQRLERLTRSINANIILSEDLVISARLDPEQNNLNRQEGISLAGHERKIIVFHDTFESEFES